MIYRKLLILVLCLFSVIQISAQTLIATLPGMAPYPVYSQVGFDNTVYLINRSSENTQLDLVNTSSYAINYSYSCPDTYTMYISGIINDMDGNGHPEVAVIYYKFEVIDGEVFPDYHSRIVDMGTENILLSHSSTIGLSSGFFIDWNDKWCMYIIDAESESVYDLNMQASTTQISQYGTAKRSTDMSIVYPNPSNNGSRIQYNLSEPGPISIVIYDNLGRIIHQKDEQFQTAGLQAFDWSNSDTFGKPVPSGMYHVEIAQNGKRILAKKITILK